MTAPRLPELSLPRLHCKVDKALWFRVQGFRVQGSRFLGLGFRSQKVRDSDRSTEFIVNSDVTKNAEIYACGVCLAAPVHAMTPFCMYFCARKFLKLH